MVFISYLCSFAFNKLLSGATDAGSGRKKTTIRIMHYWGGTDADASAKSFRTIVDEEFPKAFPNVELVESVIKRLSVGYLRC